MVAGWDLFTHGTYGAAALMSLPGVPDSDSGVIAIYQLQKQIRPPTNYRSHPFCSSTLEGLAKDLG